MFSAALVTSLLLAVPQGWQALRMRPSQKATCDLVTLMVVGPARPSLGPSGWREPGRGHVLVLVDVDHVNHPAGPMPRPRHFRLPWNRLPRLEGCCGTPGGAGWTFWWRERGHLLGFIVVAGRGTTAATRRATERMLDSLRLRA